ncbi:hypothetical protein F4808DRAFT_472914 [Astrocystis sublimbata]|nr:hypothetical protein F4808DRAFT_472914 [Astrocystis sublimbata]
MPYPLGTNPDTHHKPEKSLHHRAKDLPNVLNHGLLVPFPPEEALRVDIDSRFSTVYGYPSSGGFLVLPICNDVDLAFLQLSRVESWLRDVHRHTGAEDLHCARMRQLGAWWFRSHRYYRMLACTEQGRYYLDRKQRVIAAWPENTDKKGGVWILVLKNARAASDIPLGRLYNALSMDERCEVVKSLGGTFYSDPKACRDLEL